MEPERRSLFSLSGYKGDRPLVGDFLHVNSLKGLS